MGDEDNSSTLSATDLDGQPMLLIGAALSRTATSSLKAALQRLGHKIFHSNDALRSGYVSRRTADVAKAELAGDTEGYKEAVQALLKELSRLGYTGTVDIPMCLFFKEFMEAYPDAKVLLAVREDNDASIQKWADSTVTIAFNLITYCHKRPFLWVPWVRDALAPIFGEWLWMRLGVPMEKVTLTGIPRGRDGAGSMITAETAKELYYRYINDVTETVPPERLVRYSVKEGWGPLCEHFARPGYACPIDEPFPRSNARENGYVARLIQVLEVVHQTWPVLFAVVLLLLARLIYSIMITRPGSAAKGGRKKQE